MSRCLVVDDQEPNLYLLQIVLNWLYFHVLEEDMKYAKHLADQMKE